MPEMMQGLVKAKPEVGAEYRTDLPIPEVGARDVLVHVKAVAICGTDSISITGLHMRRKDANCR